MKLHDLFPMPGSRKNRKILGRGESSGVGKTCGKGGKGQTVRTGHHATPARFEGGQMPLYRRLPKIGFKSRVRTRGLNVFVEVSLDVLERFEAGSTVDINTLMQCGYAPTRNSQAGIKILGGGNLTKKLTVVADAITPAAKAKIEAAGGSASLTE